MGGLFLLLILFILCLYLLLHILAGAFLFVVCGCINNLVLQDFSFLQHSNLVADLFQGRLGFEALVNAAVLSLWTFKSSIFLVLFITSLALLIANIHVVHYLPLLSIILNHLLFLLCFSCFIVVMLLLIAVLLLSKSRLLRLEIPLNTLSLHQLFSALLNSLVSLKKLWFEEIDRETEIPIPCRLARSVQTAKLRDGQYDVAEIVAHDLLLREALDDHVGLRHAREHTCSLITHMPDFFWFLVIFRTLDQVSDIFLIVNDIYLFTLSNIRDIVYWL